MVTDTVTLDPTAEAAVAFTCKVCSPPSSGTDVISVAVSDESTMLRVIVVCPATGAGADNNPPTKPNVTAKRNARRIAASFTFLVFRLTATRPGRIPGPGP